MNKKLQNDWAIATNAERLRFVLVVLIMFLSSGLGVFFMFLFAFNRPTGDMDHFIKGILALAMCFLASLIKVRPAAHKGDL